MNLALRHKILRNTRSFDFNYLIPFFNSNLITTVPGDRRATFAITLKRLHIEGGYLVAAGATDTIYVVNSINWRVILLILVKSKWESQLETRLHVRVSMQLACPFRSISLHNTLTHYTPSGGKKDIEPSVLPWQRHNCNT